MNATLAGQQLAVRLFCCLISRAFQAVEVCLPSLPASAAKVPPGLEACSRCSVTTGMAYRVPWMSAVSLLPSPARERREGLC